MNFKILKNICWLCLLLGLLSCSEDEALSPKDDVVTAVDGDLRPDMVWSDGVTWLEARECTYVDVPQMSMKTSYLIVKYEFRGEEIRGEKYLKPYRSNPLYKPYNDADAAIYPVFDGKYVKASGNKVYIMSLYNSSETLIRDFSTWEVGCIVKEKFPYYDEVQDKVKYQVKETSIDRLTELAMPPDCKYRVYGVNGESELVKYIGRIYNTGLVGYSVPCGYGDSGDIYEVSAYSIILEIYNPDYGLIFRHPEYDAILSNQVPEQIWKDIAERER